MILHNICFESTTKVKNHARSVKSETIECQGFQREPTEAKREPKGTKRVPKGSQRALEGNQKDAKTSQQVAKVSNK